MLQRATKINDENKKDIDQFKKGADASPPLMEEKPEIRKITHWIKLENWRFLKELSTKLTLVCADKVTINMLLDEAVELLKRKYVESDHK